MATGYATIHQYQPLRAPKSFDREGRALILQLDEIFDDIYKRFGRLKLSDLGTTFRTDITDNWEETAELNDRTTVIEQKLTTQANVYRQAEQPTGNLKDGDIWMQVQDTFTWEEMGNFTWDDLTTETWGLWEGLAEIWVYDASSETFLKSYSGAEIVSMQTNIVQTESDIALLAEETAVLQEGFQTNSAMILVNAQSILNEVSRATNAESAKIDKTSTYQTVDAIIGQAATLADEAAVSAKNASIAKTVTYQTADSIYTAAVAAAATAAGNTYIAKTASYQTADAIINEAERLSGVAETNAKNASIAKTTDYQAVSDILNEAQNKADAAEATAKNASIAKTSTYQTADSIYSAAVAAAATAAGSTYIAKTSTYQTADAIYSAAAGYVDGELVDYSTTTQMNNAISAYVTNNAYQLVSGIAINSNGIDVTGSKYVKVRSGGTFDVDSTNMVIDSANGVFINKKYNSFMQKDAYFAFGWSSVLSDKEFYTCINTSANIVNTGQVSVTTYPITISVHDEVTFSGYKSTVGLRIGYSYTYVDDVNSYSILPVVELEESRESKSTGTLTTADVLLLAGNIRCSKVVSASIKTDIGNFYQVNASGTVAAPYIRLEGSSGTYLNFENTSTDVITYLMSLSNGEHGIYSSGYWNGSSYTSSGKWLVYRDSTGAVKLGGSLYVDKTFTWNDLET